MTRPTTLCDLPSEILLICLSHLSPIALDFVAQTLNKRLTTLCLSSPALQYRIREKKNAREMTKRFVTLKKPFVGTLGEHPACWSIWVNMGMSLAFGEYVEPVPAQVIDPFESLEYLEMNGDLQWMPCHFKGGPKRRHLNNTESMALLEEKATALGLLLPASFADFVRRPDINQHLRDRLWIGELKKVHRPNIEADEYVVEFLTDPFQRWFLYLDKTGAHAVLVAHQHNWTANLKDRLEPSLSQLEQDLGLSTITTAEFEKAELQGTCFESWLAGHCFLQWSHSYFSSSSDEEWPRLPKPLLQYTVGALTKDGREAVKKGLAPFIIPREPEEEEEEGLGKLASLLD
jgi:hypothetical protein